MNENTENLFGITEETQEVGTGKFIIIDSPEDAIKENIEITELTFNEDEKGNSFSVVVADNQGRISNRRYFEPNGKFPKKGETEADAIKREAKKINSVLMNIAHRYLGENYKTGPVGSFKTLVEKVIADIGDKHKGVKLRAVFTVQNNGFTALRGFAPIFENMDVKKEDSMLSLTSMEKANIDNGVKARKKAMETKPDNDNGINEAFGSNDSLPTSDQF